MKIFYLLIFIVCTFIPTNTHGQNFKSILKAYLDGNIDLLYQEPFTNSKYDISYQEKAIRGDDYIYDYLRVIYRDGNYSDVLHLNKEIRQYSVGEAISYKIQGRQFIYGLESPPLDLINYHRGVLELYYSLLFNSYNHSLRWEPEQLAEVLRVSFKEKMKRLIDDDEMMAHYYYGENRSDLMERFHPYVLSKLPGFDDWIDSENAAGFFLNYVNFVFEYYTYLEEIDPKNIFMGAGEYLSDNLFSKINKSFRLVGEEKFPELLQNKEIINEFIGMARKVGRITGDPYADTFNIAVENLTLMSYMNFLSSVPYNLHSQNIPSNLSVFDDIDIYVELPSFMHFQPRLEWLMQEYIKAGLFGSDDKDNIEGLKKALNDDIRRKKLFDLGKEEGLLDEYDFNSFSIFFSKEEHLYPVFIYSLPEIWTSIKTEFDKNTATYNVKKTVELKDINEETLRNYLDHPFEIFKKKNNFINRNQISLISKNGAYFLPVYFSDSASQDFLLDTGANISMINQNDLIFLDYTGKLTHIGEVEVELASGTATLKKVLINNLKVGLKTIENVELVVGDSRLLGTNILDKLGDWSIDRNQIIFK